MPPLSSEKFGSESSEKSDIPDGMRPYLAHGLDLEEESGNSKQALGDCPFCGREGKFSVETDTSKYKCFVCGVNGNNYTFVRWLWEESDKEFKEDEYQVLADNRGFLGIDPLISWGVVRSVLNGTWLVPGYGHEQKLNQLYRYQKVEGKMKLLLTPTMGHQLHYERDFKGDKKVVYLCEGPWDGMALWEVLANTKASKGGKLSQTTDIEKSLLAGADVIATPGCNVFFESWTSLFAGKTVYLLYDNDHGRKHPKTGAPIEPAALGGLRRTAGILLSSKTPPKEIRYLKWGADEEHDYFDEDLPSGHDLRDVFEGMDLEERQGALAELLDRMEPVPAEWKEERANKRKAQPLTPMPCESYKTLVSSWRKAMKWTEGLDTSLAVMLASITSTKTLGAQLWVKIMGPPSCGKTTLCEGVAVAKKYVYSKDNIRGFHSGHGAEGEDNSLIAQLYDKTLVTKDGDTLLKAPNVEQILSEARAIYDRSARTHYRNKKSKDYEGINMTWILCGTNSLREMDSSELGARFLDCVIMERIDDELEDEILMRVVNRADRNACLEPTEEANTQHPPETIEAMRLTGGYIEHLRTHATSLLTAVDNDAHARLAIVKMGKFVAYMRARPSRKQDEVAEREFAARLVEQHVRLARCLAVVMNRPSVDGEVLARVRKVAMDTARGNTLQIAHYLYEAEKGMEFSQLHMMLGVRKDTLLTLIRFMRKIGIIEPFAIKRASGVTGKTRWRLTPRLRQLYADVAAEDPVPVGEEIV